MSVPSRQTLAEILDRPPRRPDEPLTLKTARYWAQYAFSACTVASEFERGFLLAVTLGGRCFPAQFDELRSIIARVAPHEGASVTAISGARLVRGVAYPPRVPR